ncbi:MAG TPA: M56 family metallopeptidase [Gemmatimonadaceae bacterium]|jgi:beta-lactamase regulating signal transducer with metallopeptidase domain
MIATWMIYSSVVGIALFAAAMATEYLARALGIATRIGWCVVLAATLGLSARGLFVANAAHAAHLQHEPQRAVVLHDPAASFVATTARAGAHTTIATDATTRTRPTLSTIDSRLAASLRAISTRTHRLDGPLTFIAALLALVAIIRVARSLIRLARFAHALPREEHDGHEVLISDDVGPALVGVVRPQIVVPRWVFELPRADRRLILSHEHEHLTAGDQPLLIVAALLVAIQPWNVGLILTVARLRLAIEFDCDWRVLRDGTEPRRYGTLLLAVHERMMTPMQRGMAFFAGPSSLRQRVQRMTQPAPALRSMAGLASLVAVVVATAAACGAPTPASRANGPTSASDSKVSVIGVLPRCWRPNVTASFDSLIAMEMQRHPTAFADSSGKVRSLIGLVVDENCVTQRDTLVALSDSSAFPHGVDGNQVFARLFPGLTMDNPFAAVAMRGFHHGKPAVVIVEGMVPSASWLTRIKDTPCGFGLRSDEQCFTNGELAVRVLDSVRVLVAARRKGGAGAPADELFLITLQHANPAIATEFMPHGLAVYQRGALYVENMLTTTPPLFFAGSLSPTLSEQRAKLQMTRIDDVIGVALYVGTSLTLEQVKAPSAVSKCGGTSAACYEVAGHRFNFPA